MDTTKNYIATFNRFEIVIPGDAVLACSASGDVSISVEHWASKIDLSSITDNDLSDQLSEYGAWSDDELSNRKENESRIVWIAACDIRESETEKEG